MFDLKAAAAYLRANGLAVTLYGNENILWQQLCNNSAKAGAGDLFVCKGFTFKPQYLAQAKQAGAVAYLAQERFDEAMPCLLVQDVRKAQSLLAIWQFGNPAGSFCLTGITGTKGKTTTAYALKSILDLQAGRPTGLFSTVEQYVGEETEPSHLTTPESLDLQAKFARAKANGLPYVTMEVSSLAYKQQRVFGLTFDYGIYLNLGEDHISPLEHPDLEDYALCKLQLMQNCKTAVIYRELTVLDAAVAAAKEKAARVLVFDLLQENEDFSQSGLDYAMGQIQKLPRGFSFTVFEQATGQSFDMTLGLEGRFNLLNALAAICVARGQKIDWQTIASGLKNLQVPGRMNLIEGKDLQVLVDYAHNKLSFSALFASLRADAPHGHISVVCGAPGQRDENRRVHIGALCGQWADQIYFTADDPGFDSVTEICAQMQEAAAPYGKPVSIIPDRTAAIETAIANAPAGGLVLLAGKGAEVTQRVNDQWVYYESDPVVAARALKVRDQKI